LFRSEDGGVSWTRAEARLAEACIFVNEPRITQIIFDPQIGDRLWCSVEIDGIHRSDDGGRSWQKVAGEGLVSEDIHGLAVTTTGGGDCGRPRTRGCMSARMREGSSSIACWMRQRSIPARSSPGLMVTAPCSSPTATVRRAMADGCCDRAIRVSSGRSYHFPVRSTARCGAWR